MITLTQEAQNKVSSMLAGADDKKALRIFIEPGGSVLDIPEYDKFNINPPL